MIKLNCPSCGGVLEIPDNLGIVHCLYCGAKILLDQDDSARKQLDLQKYVELRKISISAKNYKDAIDYCNKILEIDFRNIDTWIDKAIATFWRTAGLRLIKSGYEEAIEYLKQAKEMAPDNSRISEVMDELKKQDVLLYVNLGDQLYNEALNNWNTYCPLMGKESAARLVLTYFDESMNYYLLALINTPEEISILERIERLVSVPGKYISWPPEVQAKLKSLGALRAKKEAEEKLPRLRNNLQKAEASLIELKKKKGFFSKLDIKDKEDEIIKIKSLIELSESYKTSDKK
jgi:tetratricopeptide (TPR) repeat protein